MKLIIKNIDKMAYQLIPTKSDYDVPLCIYLSRVADETGRYKMENNLMDVDNWVLASAIQNQKLFQNVLMVYANEVIVKWAKDQQMI